jgi:hypothetical protein
MTSYSLLKDLNTFQAEGSLGRILPYQLAFRGTVLEVQHVVIGDPHKPTLSSKLVFGVHDLFASKPAVGPLSRGLHRITVYALRCGQVFQPDREYIVFANSGWTIFGDAIPRRVYGYLAECAPPYHVPSVGEEDLLSHLTAEALKEDH